MKPLRQLCLIILMPLALSLPAFAGDINCGTIGETQPSVTGDIECGVTENEGNGVTGETELGLMRDIDCGITDVISFLASLL